MSIVPCIKKNIYQTVFLEKIEYANIMKLMKTENKIEIRNLSMFIMKSYENRKQNFILISMPLMLSSFGTYM